MNRDEIKTMVDSVPTFTGRKALAPVTTLPTWPEPLLPGAIQTPEIPSSILPGWLGDMAAAVAHSTQTPPAAAVLAVLSIVATALHRRFEVAPFGDEYVEPLSLWTLTTLPSGARKTAVLNAVAAPLVRWEKLERDRLRPEIARVLSLRAVAKKRIERLQQDAAKAGTPEERERIRAEIQREEEEMPAEQRAPRLFSGDVTAERLQNMLVEHGERMSVLSDEAGIFLIMAGVYSGGLASLDVFLQGHSGTPMRVDRAGRLAHLDRPALSFSLLLQPGILSDLAGGSRFRDSGLLARFLYAVPKSTVGTRNVRERNPIPPDVVVAFERNLFSLLDGWTAHPGAPRTLVFEEAAREPWLDLAEEIERGIGEAGRFEPVADWAAKLPGAVARMATLMELATRGVGAQSVGMDSVRRAVGLGRVLIPHAEAAFRLLGNDKVEGDAVALLKWIQANELREFDRREAQKSLEGRFRTVDKLKAAARRLEEWHVISPEMQRRNRGARPTPYHLVNPRLFDLPR